MVSDILQGSGEMRRICLSAGAILYRAGAVLFLTLAASACSDPSASVVSPDDTFEWNLPLADKKPPPLNLHCSPSHVSFNSTVMCTLGEVPLGHVVHWEFFGEGGQYIDRPGAPFESGWTGQVVVGGTVEATVTELATGASQWVFSEFTVQRRGWTWGNEVTWRRANPGEIDHCFSSPGFATGKSCTAQNTHAHFTPASVPDSVAITMAVVPGNGPNGGFSYGVNPAVSMDLRPAIHRVYRADGDTVNLPMLGHHTVTIACGPSRKNHYQVNMPGGCAPRQGFADWFDYLWEHEEAHVMAAVAAAKEPQGDLPALWETLVRPDSTMWLFFFRGEELAAHNHILQASQCTHKGEFPTFHFWLNDASQWSDLGVIAQDSIPNGC